jgi:CHAT domain-containing protein
MLRALAYSHLGMLPDADSNLNQALRDCDSFRCESAGKLAGVAGAVRVDENRTDDAQQFFLTSLRISRERADRFLEASALLNLGVVAMGKEHFDESIDWSEQSQQIARAIDSGLDEEKALGNIGWDYYKLGDFQKSLTFFEAASKKAHELEAFKDETIWLNNLGHVYSETDQADAAEGQYVKSLQLAKRIQNADLTLASLNALAFLSVRNGRVEEAQQYSQQSLDLASRIKDRLDELSALLAQGQIAAASSDFVAAEKLFLEVASDPVSDTSLRWEAQNSLAKLYEAEGRAGRAEKTYRQAIATVESARSAIQHEDFRLPFLANAAHLYDDYIHFLVAKGRTVQALQAADYSRAQTLEEGLGLRPRKESSASEPPLTLSELAKKTNATILFYWLGPEHSYLWAFNSERTTFVTLPSSVEIDGLLQQYRRILTGPRDPLETGAEVGTHLYDKLIRPVQKLIPANGRVIIIPDGELNTLNFETLMVREPRLHYWIDDVTVLTATSLRLLPFSRPRRHNSDKLLLIGDPVSASPDFEALPNAALEVQKIESHFPDDRREVLVREQATPAGYLASDPGQFSFVHFVAHGTASTMSPLDSSVVLSKNGTDDAAYKLYARDVIAHPLHAELVTISSCYGSGTRFYTGEGLVGLSWSFLRAGAQNVIGALWAVSDNSTPGFMDDFYNQLARGNSPETALRSAKLHMLHSDAVFRKPFYWAPFQLYTGS